MDAIGILILIGADVNARATAWHDPSPDERDEIVVEMIRKKNLSVMNEPGGAPTFRNNGAKSGKMDGNA